LPNQAALTKTD